MNSSYPHPTVDRECRALVKRSATPRPSGATKSDNRNEAKNRTLAGWNCYTTNLTRQTDYPLVF
jgi:hypothetical protein